MNATKNTSKIKRRPARARSAKARKARYRVIELDGAFSLTTPAWKAVWWEAPDGSVDFKLTARNGYEWRERL